MGVKGQKFQRSESHLRLGGSNLFKVLNSNAKVQTLEMF